MADESPGDAAGRRPLTSTYRLQLHAGFGFAAAAENVPYLARLGISHLYLSPVLQAAAGSTHGYDVLDHTRVSDDLGGEAGLVSLAEVAHEHAMGIVVDVVPNHMSIPAATYLNRPLWDVLRLGRDSDAAAWFDIDWDLCGGKLGLPLLGAPLTQTLEARELTLGEHGGQPVVRYHDHVFPVAAGTGSGTVDDVLARQHYQLAGWREKDEVLNYRRFFDIDTLIAVRVELAEVFDATHAVLVDLHRRGIVDGFRIDHPDGLADPEHYLDQLRDATNGAWVVVEKILQHDERLPASWATAGTTGYDAIRVVQQALAPPSGADLDALWRAVDGAEPLEQTELVAKNLALYELLRPELLRLVRRAVTAARDAGHEVSAGDLETALGALLVHVQVYRAYVRLGSQPDGQAVAQIDAQHAGALAGQPELAASLDLVRSLLLDATTKSAAGRDLVVRYQQVCGPVMAKGVEDTTFYRWHRFVALNEVGGDPAALDEPDPQALHTWAEGQSATHPLGMTTLSTHDTKRGEDVRAQLLAAGEDADNWAAMWSLVRAQAVELEVDEPTAYLLMQTLVGAWPISLERLDAYLEKATREAKQFTTWSDPDDDYEQNVYALAAHCLGDDLVAGALAAWVDNLASSVRAVTLGSKLVQLTLPGVPDVYQGCETVERFLVDPDNRRPVDFGSRRERLDRLDSGGPRDGLDDDKLWVTSRALRLRRDEAQLFGAASTYRPLTTASAHAVGFIRGERLVTLVMRWPGWLERDGWAGAAIALPDGEWVDVLNGRRYTGGDEVQCEQLLADLPVALLLRESE